MDVDTDWRYKGAVIIYGRGALQKGGAKILVQANWGVQNFNASF